MKGQADSMKKLKIILRNLAFLIAGIVGLVVLDHQSFEKQMLTGMYVLVISVVYFFYFTNQRFNQLGKEKLYTCIFEKEVIAANSNQVITSFEVEYKLPFVPFIGLKVAGHLNPPAEDCDDDEGYDDDHDFQSFYTGKITSVVWRYSHFLCKVEPYKMQKNTTIEEVIIGHCADAWCVDGLYLIGGAREALSKYIDKNLSKLEKPERIRLEKVKQKLGLWS